MMPPRLHAVTDDRVVALPDFLSRVRALALGPAVALHVRARMNGRALLSLVERARAAVDGSGTLVIVNDRADVARLSGADGVHLPARGLPVARARALGVGWVGRSAHVVTEARRTDADWVFLGPIWTTRSHPERPALGPAALTAAGSRVVAIGGMTPTRGGEAAAAGAAGIAAISALWDADDPGAAARALLLCFEG